MTSLLNVFIAAWSLLVFRSIHSFIACDVATSERLLSQIVGARSISRPAPRLARTLAGPDTRRAAIRCVKLDGSDTFDPRALAR
jgi:hypothetical protein